MNPMMIPASYIANPNPRPKFSVRSFVKVNLRSFVNTDTGEGQRVGRFPLAQDELVEVNPMPIDENDPEGVRRWTLSYRSREVGSLWLAEATSGRHVDYEGELEDNLGGKVPVVAFYNTDYTTGDEWISVLKSRESKTPANAKRTILGVRL